MLFYEGFGVVSAEMQGLYYFSLARPVDKSEIVCRSLKANSSNLAGLYEIRDGIKKYVNYNNNNKLYYQIEKRKKVKLYNIIY